VPAKAAAGPLARDARCGYSGVVSDLRGFEKLGAFYLGRVAGDDGQPTEELRLYDSRDLTTHAVCVGVTGSGKTGLCIALLEEAALAIYTPGSAARLHPLHRPSLGRGAHVLRHAAALRGDRVDARAGRAPEPARDPRHGPGIRVPAAHGEPAVEDAHAELLDAEPQAPWEEAREVDPARLALEASSEDGALFGRTRGSAANVGRATTAARGAQRAARSRGDVARAQAELARLQAELESLEAESPAELDRVRQEVSEADLALEEVPIPPRRGDLSVDPVTLVWLPSGVSGAATGG
jgi:hypothetical protein